VLAPPPPPARGHVHVVVVAKQEGARAPQMIGVAGEVLPDRLGRGLVGGDPNAQAAHAEGRRRESYTRTSRVVLAAAQPTEPL